MTWPTVPDTHFTEHCVHSIGLHLTLRWDDPPDGKSSKVALFARLPKVAPGEIIFLWSGKK